MKTLLMSEGNNTKPKPDAEGISASAGCVAKAGSNPASFDCDYLNARNAGRALIIEQIIHCTYGNRARRTELENMPIEMLRAEWRKTIGDFAEDVGI